MPETVRTVCPGGLGSGGILADMRLLSQTVDLTCVMIQGSMSKEWSKR
jgi:hypothetical protein